MKVWAAVLFSVVTAGAAVAQAPAVETADPTLLATERRWLDAYERNDADGMAGILADEFVITYAHGARMDRTQTLADVRGSTQRLRYCTFDTQARTSSEGVTLTGTVLMQDRDQAQAMRYTDLWVRDGTGWRVRRSDLSAPAAEPTRRCG